MLIVSGSTYRKKQGLKRRRKQQPRPRHALRQTDPDKRA